MARIKTRETIKGSVKTVDRAVRVAGKINRAYISTREKASPSVGEAGESPEEEVSDQYESAIGNITYKGARQFNAIGRKDVKSMKKSYDKVRHDIRKFKEDENNQKAGEQAARQDGKENVQTREHTLYGDKGNVRVEERAPENVGETSRTVRTEKKKMVKGVSHEKKKVVYQPIKTVEQTGKSVIKTTKQAMEGAKETFHVSGNAMQKVMATTKRSVKESRGIVSKALKAARTTMKLIIAGTRSLVTTIMAGMWMATVVILVICTVALLLNSVFGVFFSGEDSGTGMTMQMVVQEINAEYDARLDKEKASVSYDVLEMSGSRAVWKEVLAVYAVRVNTNPNAPQEVATMDGNKKRWLKDIFWDMNEIRSRTETRQEVIVTETDDGYGNIVQTEDAVEQTYLYITVSHKTVDDMAIKYGFSQEQKYYLAELLKKENDSLWSAAMYGIGAGDEQIVTIASSQLGNVGGRPYWSWYGFGNRVEWCACFVSWCANECGYIDVGVMPKFSLCDDGVNWFKNKGQWADGSYEPSPGAIIFFDWDGNGVTDHVGIVQKCENGMVYTIEGNAGDRCKAHTYVVGAASIYGYGIPTY